MYVCSKSKHNKVQRAILVAYSKCTYTACPKIGLQKWETVFERSQTHCTWKIRQSTQRMQHFLKGKGKGHPCTGTEALYRPYGP